MQSYCIYSVYKTLLPEHTIVFMTRNKKTEMDLTFNGFKIHLNLQTALDKWRDYLLDCEKLQNMNCFANTV